MRAQNGQRGHMDTLAHAGLSYEYAAYNELPDGVNLADIKWGDRHWFVDPIRTGFDLPDMIDFVRECNINRDIHRKTEPSIGMSIDETVGGAHVRVVLRHRLIIKLPFQDVK